MITFFILNSIAFLTGYYLGGRGKELAKEMKDTIQEKIEERKLPSPGVVRHLTDEEIEEKHNPIKRGNLESFKRLFKQEGWEK